MRARENGTPVRIISKMEPEVFLFWKMDLLYLNLFYVQTGKTEIFVCVAMEKIRMIAAARGNFQKKNFYLDCGIDILAKRPTLLRTSCCSRL